MLGRYIKIFINNYKSQKPNWKVIIPLSLGLSFIISTGPWIQFYTLSILTSETISIYGSVYQDGFAIFPSLNEWIKGGLTPVFLFISILISYISLKWKSPRQILWTSFLSSFFLLSSLDIFKGILNQKLSIIYILQNLIGNFFGGFLIAFIVILFLISYEACLSFIPTKKVMRYISASILTISLGIINATIIYYMVLFFFKPLPLKIDVVLAPPITAAFANIYRKTEKLKNNSFKTINLSSVDFQSSLEADGPNVLWESTKKNNLFNVKISFYEGCLNSDPIKNGNGTLNIKDISMLNILFDEGHTNFKTFKDNKMIGSTTLETKGVTQFWAIKMKQSPFIELKQHLWNKDKLTYNLEGGNIRYYFSGYLFQQKNNQRKTTLRTVTIQTNKSNYQIKLQPPKNIKLDEKIQCKPLQYKRTTDDNHITLNSTSLSAGLLVSIYPQSKQGQFESYNPSKLVLTKPEGILTLKYINPKDIQQSLGNLNFLQFWDKAPQIKIDDKIVETTKFDRYHIIGDLEGYYRNNAEIRITGKGEIVENGSLRINQTKWEKLDWNYRSFLIGIFSLLFYSLSKIIFERLRDNKKISHL